MAQIPQETISSSGKNEDEIMLDGDSGRILTIASGKGGTGKTVLAANLATALAIMGKKVVAVDADIGMADLGLYLGLEKSPITLHEVLGGVASVEQALYEGPGGCRILPSGLSLSGFSRANPQRLNEVVKELSSQFDIVLVDCGPGLSKESTMPLAVADEVLIVVNPDVVCLADALRVKMMCDAMNTPVKGVVVNRSGVSKAELAASEVGSMLGLNILAVIPEDEEMRKSAKLKVPVVMKKKDSPAAIAQMKLAQILARAELPEISAKSSRDQNKPKLKSLFGR